MKGRGLAIGFALAGAVICLTGAVAGGQEADRAPKLVAVLIGVEGYEAPIRPRSGAVPDVVRLERWLRDTAGWDADRDCVKAGLSIGSWCVVSCWALMLACVLCGHHLVALLIGASIGLAESISFRPPRTFVRIASVALAMFFAGPPLGHLFTR